MAILVMAALVAPALAQGRARGRNYSKADVERIIKRVEDNSDDFKKLIDREMDRSAIDKTRLEDNIWEQTKDLENALDRLRRKFDRSDTWLETREEVSDVLKEARDINQLLNRVRITGKVQAAWATLRYDLNTLAGVYNLGRLR
jgi:hypothetical protein